MNRLRGSAMVETVVLMTVLVPLLFGIALVGKYLDVKGASLEAARYVVWERTVWSDPSGSWQDGEVSKTDYQVGREAHALVLGHPGAMVDWSGAREQNPMWVNRRQERMLTGVGVVDDRGRPRRLAGSTELNAVAPPVAAPLVDNIASGPVGTAGLAGAAEAVSSGLGALASGCGIGVALRDGLGLGSNNFVEAAVAVPSRDYLGRPGAEFTFRASAAILTNSWAAPDPKTFRQRVDNLTVDELVGCAALPGRIFAAVSLGTDQPLYGEGLRSYPVREALQPDVLPRVTER